MNTSDGNVGLVDRLMGSYNYLMDDLRDPRVDGWLGMYSIWPTTFICIFYVYFVKVLGPKFMENREPYDIKRIMIAYNLFQTLFSFWMFKGFFSFFVTGNYSWRCQPVDYSNSHDALRILDLGWWYFFSKFVDLLDTIFFVSRKKYNQVTALHVIHHSTLPWLSWWGPRFVGGGNTCFGPFLNCGVHTVMYGYYLLSAFGPSVQKYLWWKKYITTLQLIQFVMVFCQAIQPFFFECDYPLPATLMFAGTGIQYFILFSAFYKKAYKKPTAADAKKNDDIVEGVERVARNTVTQLDKSRKTSIGVLSGKIEKED